MVCGVILLAVLTLFGCGGAPESEQSVLAKSGVLAGAWEVEIRTASGLFRSSRPIARGKLTFSHAPEPEEKCRGEEFVCSTFVVGHHSIDFPPEVRPYTVDSSAWAVRYRSGEVLLHLGPCCDQGELEAKGKLSGGRIDGKWWQVFLQPKKGGRIVLSRLDQNR